MTMFLASKSTVSWVALTWPNFPKGINRLRGSLIEPPAKLWLDSHIVTLLPLSSSGMYKEGSL